MSDHDPLIIWAPETINQTTTERLAELIRAGGIDYKREHDPKWRDKPYKDGIVVDLDESDVVDHITRYVIQHAAAQPSVT